METEAENLYKFRTSNMSEVPYTPVSKQRLLNTRFGHRYLWFGLLNAVLLAIPSPYLPHTHRKPCILECSRYVKLRASVEGTVIEFQGGKDRRHAQNEIAALEFSLDAFTGELTVTDVTCYFG